MFTVDNLWVLSGLIVFIGLIVLLVFLKKKLKLGFSLRVLIALVLGIGFGVALQLIFGAETNSGAGLEIKKWVDVIGTGFTKSLQLLIVPLVLVSIVNAVTKLKDSKQGAKKAGKIIAFLLVTTAVSAVITIGVVKIFNLSADKLIEAQSSAKVPPDIAETFLGLIPANLFAALSSGSVLPTVFIAALIGFPYLAIKKENPAVGSKFESFLETAYELVMKVVEFVINFTPYGILAIIAGRAASGNWQFILQLGYIITVSFAAMLAVFLLHLLIAWIAGVSPARYLKKAAPALLFSFSSRSSAASLPLTIDAQRKLGVSEANANLAGALGTCIGQNGCAGVYPTILAILVGLVQGWNVWSVYFLVPLVIYVVIASIGTAGVGGGATQVSLLVLSLLGLPVELVAILISVDFIIDMGRTLLNVNDSILAGFVVGRQENDINKDILFDKVSLEEVRKREALEKTGGANI